MKKNSNPSKLQDEIQLGREFAKSKDYKKAESIFLGILKKQPMADVYNDLGMTYADSGDFGAAEFCFKKALKINPDYLEASLNLSILYNNLGFQKKSKPIYERLKKYGAKSKGAADPLLLSKIANLYAEIGDLFHGVGENREAVEAYEKAVSYQPDYVDVQTKLAVAYRELGKKTKALETLKKIRKRAHRYAPYWMALGVTYYAQKKMKQAHESWKKALQIDPENSSAKAYLRLFEK
jgi:tetratricopeptide (TPR) repeat protein